MASNPPVDEVKRARFYAYLNGKYHSDRGAFYDWCDKLTNFGVLVTGAVAFSDVFGDAAQKLGAATLGLFALAQLVFSLSVKAREHFQFKREYFSIASRVEAGKLKPRQAFAEMTRVAGDEPPPFMALHAIAENWAKMAIYGDSEPPPCRVGWFAILTRHVWRHSSTDFSAGPTKAPRESIMKFFFGWG